MTTKFGFRERARATKLRGVGPQVSYLFPVGDRQGYVNLKGYKEFDNVDRPDGWNVWLTLSISPKAPEAPTLPIVTK